MAGGPIQARSNRGGFSLLNLRNGFRSGHRAPQSGMVFGFCGGAIGRVSVGGLVSTPPAQPIQCDDDSDLCAAGLTYSFPPRARLPAGVCPVFSSWI